MKFLSTMLLLLVICACQVQGQESDLTEILYTTYQDFKEKSLEKRRIKHADLQPLINKYVINPKFQVNKVGESIEGRDLHLISIGNGDIDVFLWSQMHGNEPTATQAIFDILNFLDSKSNVQEKKEIFRRLRVHFLPMLNPDGAEVFQRRNTLDIDINRDALRLQSPEGQALKRVRDSLEADFGFNLHDQSIYYNAERTPKPATISYLAPAFNYEKDINDVRGNAMKVIGFMNGIIQKYAPGQVGRYNDDFEPRAFGDNIQRWGTSTILIESGGFSGDTEKQEIRKLNYVSILSAIYSIATGNYDSVSIDDYWAIPENDRKLFDLKLEQLSYNLLGKEYILDLGINLQEVDDENHSDFWYKGRISDQGDLSTFYGYETLNAKGYLVREAKVYHQVLESLEELNDASALNLLDEGYAYVRVDNLAKDQVFSPYPVHVITENYELPEFKLGVGKNPTFFLEHEGELKYAVVNGFLIDLKSGSDPVRMNGLLLR